MCNCMYTFYMLIGPLDIFIGNSNLFWFCTTMPKAQKTRGSFSSYLG